MTPDDAITVAKWLRKEAEYAEIHNSYGRDQLAPMLRYAADRIEEAESLRAALLQSQEALRWSLRFTGGVLRAQHQLSDDPFDLCLASDCVKYREAIAALLSSPVAPRSQKTKRSYARGESSAPLNRWTNVGDRTLWTKT